VTASIATLLKHPLTILGGFMTAGMILMTTTAAGAASLPNTGTPPGFTIQDVAGGFNVPTAAAFAPDGRIFVAEKGGAVKIVKNGQTLATPFYTVQNVNTYVDRGLLGLALDPNFAANGYVYLLYTYDNNPGHDTNSKTGRLLRVTANGDTAATGSEQVILGSTVGTAAKPSCENYPVNTDCIPDDYFSHGPDTLQFGPDGKLYASIGESASYDNTDTRAFRAQNLDSFAGKMLRINPDGTAPADNPFYTGNPNDIKSKIYAYGFRNPFRFGIHPTTGRIAEGEVGWATWEEVNTILPGKNYGWPCYEGFEQQNGIPEGTTGAYKDFPQCQDMYANPPANLTFPAKVYEHPPGSAIVGGMFYTGSQYPATWQDTYFYGDYARNQIYTLKLDANGAMVPGSDQTFASNAAGPVCFFTGPNGDIYYVGIYTNTIYKINYSTENQPPSAVAAADKNFGPAPLSINFSSGGSSDPEDDPLTYTWNFGDGSAASTAANPTHVYNANGVYTATLTVTDSHAQNATAQVKIFVGQEPPALSITTPADKTVANVDDVINFAGSGSDNGNPIPNDQLHWTVTIQHCPLESCHIHQMLTTTGSGGSFVFPAHEKPFYIEVTLTATSQAGLTATKTVSVYPTGEPITQSMDFDGLNDFAMAAKPEDFKLQTFTTEAWVKSLSTDDDGEEVISQGDNWMLRLVPTGGVAFSWANGDGWEGVEADNVNIVDGIWHHVAVTKTATGVKVYVDGIKILDEANAVPIAYVLGTNLYVGQHGNGSDRFNFNGAIDELRVWSSPRTDAQIEQYRNMTLPASELGKLVAYYKADEGNGTNVVDNSANGQHPLTLINGANWTAGAPLADPPATIPITNLKDNFTGTVIDTTTKWTKVGTASRTTQNNTLNIAPTANATGTFGVTSKGKYDLTGTALTVEVPQVTNANGTAETQLVAELDANNRLIVVRNKNGLVLRQRVNGANTDKTVTWNATNMRWWRIREAGGKIFYETSANGQTWTTRQTLAKPFDITNLGVRLTAGTTSAVASPGSAKFDNLNLPPQPAINNAVVLNGATGKASVNGAGLYDLQTFTVEAWAKIQNTSLTGSEILSNGDSYGLRAETDGSVTFFMYKGADNWEGYNAYGVNLKDGAWHHIAVVKSASSVIVYLDGITRLTQAVSGNISYTLGTNVVMGAHGNGSADFNLTGSIDEVRIWSTARTASQIQANMQKEITAPQTGLVGYWQFNASSGTSAIDTSGNNKNLTLTSGASWGAGFPKL
jgi:glucose/arabinose dehydrogenase